MTHASLIPHTEDLITALTKIAKGYEGCFDDISRVSRRVAEKGMGDDVKGLLDESTDVAGDLWKECRERISEVEKM